MKSCMERLFYDYLAGNSCDKPANRFDADLASAMNQLKRDFNKNQKKLLLRIMDAQDLRKEECNLESFIAGFKIGLQIGYESNKE